MIKPIQYNSYKGAGTGKWGALQINFGAPHYYCSNNKCRAKNYNNETPVCNCEDTKMIQREGALFLEITSAKAPNIYDWDNKIIMALSINDLGKILLSLRTGQEIKLLHDPGVKTEQAGKVRKTLMISSPKGIEAGCIVTATEVNETNGDNPKKHTIPLSYDEVITLAILFQAAIPK